MFAPSLTESESDEHDAGAGREGSGSVELYEDIAGVTPGGASHTALRPTICARSESGVFFSLD